MSTTDEAARAAEATSDVVSIEYRGVTLTAPRHRSDWSLDFHEAMADGVDDVIFLRLALGPDQWRIVKGMGLKGSDIAEMTRLMIQGFGWRSSGESQPSAD